MAEQEKAAEKTLAISKIFVKDFSFESPQSPAVFRRSEWKPQTNLNLRSSHSVVEDNVHEVVLTITVEAKEGTAVEEFKFDDKEGVEGEDDTSPQVAQGATRRLQRKKKGQTAMDVTLILRISLSNLPIDLLGNMANVAIESNEQELQHLLHKEQHFYTFFRLVDGVRSRTINELTEAPTLSPTTKEYYEAKQAELEAATLAQDEEESVEEDTGVGE